MTTAHAGCFRLYGKCKHMNRIWVTIERTCKRTAKKIGYRQHIGIEHQDLQCKRGLCLVTTVPLVSLLTLSSGIASILEQNLSFYFFSLNIQTNLSLIFICIQKLQKKSNVWIWRSPLLLYQTLLCTTALWRPQWQETQEHCTKTWTTVFYRQEEIWPLNLNLYQDQLRDEQ